MSEVIKKQYPTCSVLERLVKENIPPALFIGSGITKRYISNYPNWLDFIIQLGNMVGLSEFEIRSQYNAYKAEELTESEAILHTTLSIENKLQELIRNGQANKVFSDAEQQEILANNYSNIKYLASKIFKDATIDADLPEYKHTELRLFSQLKSNIPYVFTTNYDDFLENIFSDYKCFISQSDYLYNNNSEYAEIYKLHGSYKEPNSMVFTENDYRLFEEQSYISISKLVCVLSERPIIFMGYSLNDPDILDILNKMTSCLDEKHIKQFEKNLIVINWDDGNLSLPVHKYTINLDKSKSLTFTYVSTDNYCRVLYYINRIQPTAKFSEVRKFRKLLKELVDTNDKKLPILIRNVVENANNSTEGNTTKIVAYPTDNISPEAEVTAIVTPTEGYKKLALNKLLYEALYKGESYSAVNIITEWFMSNCSSKITAPIFYYYNQLSSQQKKNLPIEVREKFKTYKLNKQYQINDFLKIPTTNLTKTTWERTIKKEKQPKKQLAILGYVYHICQWIDTDEYRLRLQKFYENDSRLIDSTEMKKAILLLDY